MDKRIICIILMTLCFPFNLYALPTHEGTVIGGGYQFNMPYDIEIAAGTTWKGYVSSQANACVLTIDFSASKPAVTGQINIPGGGTKQAAALALNNVRNELYVLDPFQKAVFVIHPDTDTIDSVSMKVGGSPQNMLVSEDGVLLYVSASSNDEIHVINTITLQSAAVISLGEDADPYGLAIAGKKLYAVGEWSQKVYIIDIDDQSASYHTILKTIPVGSGAYDAVSSGQYVFISHNTTDGKISVIDSATDSVKTAITIKNAGETSAKNTRGMTIVNGVLYAVNQGDSTLTLIDAVNHVKLLPDHTILTGGNGPLNLTASPDGKKLYCVHSVMGSVEIINIEHPVQYTLAVDTEGGCTGEVSSSPAGISCGSDCSEIFDWKTAVTLSTSVPENCVFTGWSGGGCSGTNPCSLKMNQNISVTASFSTLQSYAVSVVTTGASTGTVTSSPAGILCGIDCNETYPVNSVVTLSAAPSEGYKIKEWSGGSCEGSTNSCTIVLKQKTDVYVAFEELPPKTMTVTSTGKGMGTVVSDPAGIDCGESCAKSFKHGTPVTLRVTPADGYEFTEWSGACSGSGECRLVMNADQSVKANFVLASTNKSKAIVVAGGGPFNGNFLWDQTRICGQYAFRTLLCQGFPRQNIFYLTEDTGEVSDCSNVKYKANGSPSLASLKSAITSWAADAESLILYLVDHGGDNSFRIAEKETIKADDPSSSEDLKGYLNALQAVMPGRVIVIYDACQSGSFIPKLASADKKRIVITSTNSEQNAMFLRQGRLSFSYQFWTAVFEGAPLNKGFAHAVDMMETFQTPQADANGDGIAEGEVKLLSNIYIGIAAGIGAAPPSIDSVSENQQLTGQTQTSFSVSGVTGENTVTEVHGVILPPCLDRNTADVPVTELPEIIFQKGNTDGNYVGTYNGFTDIGEYVISIYAIDIKGFQSLDKTLIINQTVGIPCYRGDINRDGAVNLMDAIVCLKILSNSDTSGLIQDAAFNPDVNADHRIGLEELIYVLQKVLLK